jgi:hypothetical protein
MPDGVKQQSSTCCNGLAGGCDCGGAGCMRYIYSYIVAHNICCVGESSQGCPCRGNVKGPEKCPPQTI